MSTFLSYLAMICSLGFMICLVVSEEMSLRQKYEAKRKFEMVTFVLALVALAMIIINAVVAMFY